MIAERLAKTLVKLVSYQERIANRRAVLRRVREAASAEALAKDEAARGAERLDMARRLFAWAKTFPQTCEGQWCFQHWWRWQIGWDLFLDARGVIRRAAVVHSFGRVPEQIIKTPESLADTYPIGKLRDMIQAIEADFWRQALSREAARLFLPTGRSL